MPSLYDEISPSATPAPAGSEAYQKNIVDSATRRLRPQYDQAVRMARQAMANRGMTHSGLMNEAESGLRQNFLGNVANISEQAATRASDLAEQERVRQMMRGWQIEDYQKALEERRTAQQKAEDQANAQMWNQLISQAAGSIGSYYGGQLGGQAASGLTSAALNSNNRGY